MLTVIRQQQAAEAQLSAAEHRLQTHLHKQLYGLTMHSVALEEQLDTISHW